MPRNAITRYAACLLTAGTVASAAQATEVVQAWWTPGDPAPDTFGFAEASKVLPDGRTAFLIHFIDDDQSELFAHREDHRPGPPPEAYRLPDQGGQILAAIAQESTRAQMVVLGHSVLGRPIEALWLGQRPGSGAPVYRILGGHHGDEWSSFEVPLAIAEALAAGDGTVAEVTRILDRNTVWIAPYINPDGIADGSRYNATFVDLNRNYDYAWSALEFLPGEYPFSEPETRAIQSNSHYDLPFVGLTYHSGATNIGYVWNHTLEPAPDRDLLIEMSVSYAAATGYPQFWVTNGADWYITSGDTNDWSYGRYGVPDFTVEVTEEKAPPAEEIGNFVPGHVSAAIDILGREPTLSGRVVDDETGRPVMARIELNAPTAVFYSDPVAGSFHRMVADGTFDLTASAAGYETTQLTVEMPVDDVVVQMVRRHVAKEPLWAAVILGDAALSTPDSWTGAIQLYRPGSDPVVEYGRNGRVFIDPQRLARGAWTVQIDGDIWLRELIVADSALSSVSWQGESLLIEGDFHPGSRAWAIFGPDRALHPLIVIAETPDRLTVDGSGVPHSGRVDVMVLSGGRHAALADIYDIFIDNSIISDSAIVGNPVGCACRVTTGHLGLHPLSVLLLMIFIRRRTP